MISKLENYFKKVLSKRAPICATILDPRLKMNYFLVSVFHPFLFLSFTDQCLYIYTKDRATTFAEYDLHTSDIRCMFELEAIKYEVDVPNTPSTATKKKYTTTSTSRYFEDAIFGAQDTHPDRSISNEIARYLGEQIEARDEKVLQFWKKRVDVYPGLANMAMDLLAIPATSCPSEGVFNKTKRILAPQRTNLSCLHVEALLCVKGWHHVFGPLKIGSHEESD